MSSHSPYPPPAPRTRSGAFEAVRSDDLGLVGPLAPSDARESAARTLDRARRALAGLSDTGFAAALGAVLFALCAYPLLLVEVPPYQDVPNHLATATVLAHPELYPELVSNGFLKTNAALFLWLHVAGGVVGLKVALKAFCVGVLGLNAFVLPRFVLALSDRRRAAVACLLAWPMVHNWFVAMGMLDFALSVPLALLLLLALDRYAARPAVRSGAAVLGLGLAVWYAHVFALLVVHLLVVVRAAEEAWAARRSGARRAWTTRLRRSLPLLPATLLVLASLARHATEPRGVWAGFVDARRSLPVWELAYNAWAEWHYGFTWLSASSLLPAVALVALAWRARREPRGFLSPIATGVLFALYLLVPYSVTNWFHVNSRFLPFLWVALLVRVPARLPRPLAGALMGAAAAYAVGQGVDFVRLDRERALFTEGVAAVPERARLLPLVFRHKETSDNTRNLAHLWGFYVMERHASAPLVFAHSRSFPLSYARPPEPRWNQLVLENFALSMGTPAWTCDALRTGGVAGDCEATWRERWREFWADATPRFDHVLAWDMPPEAEALVPPRYRAVFRNEKLVIYARLDDHVASL